MEEKQIDESVFATEMIDTTSRIGNSRPKDDVNDGVVVEGGGGGGGGGEEREGFSNVAAANVVEEIVTTEANFVKALMSVVTYFQGE